MSKDIQNRLEALRDILREEYLSAFIIPSTDPHCGEYIPAHYESRAWISGFNGSAGTIVVTINSAALWTDSRYFIEAERVLKGTGIELMRLRVEGTPSIAEWLATQVDKTSSEVALDGLVNTFSEVENLRKELRERGGMTLRTNFDPFKRIWKERPPLSLDKVKIQPIEYAGESTKSKIERIRKALRGQGADGILVNTLDDIAWITNLRGSDVECNPLFVSYLLISSTTVTLFIDSRKLTDEVKSYLSKEGIQTAEYTALDSGIRKYPDYNILLDPETISYTIAKSIKDIVKVYNTSPVSMMKAVKNEAEIAGFHLAMKRDGVAMVKFLSWLENAVKTERLTEVSIAEKLEKFRKGQEGFKGISFHTIAGYEANGAIVHHTATPDNDTTIKPQGLLLLDSGVHYDCGTTDITRTIPLGDITEEQRLCYTLVLKGMINLAMAKFPKNITGTQLDILARSAMWAEGYNYLHGTGHGVGSFLNVHEGPHQIRMEWKPAPLVDGMTVTDEPGIYVEGKFGIRIENTLLITKDKTTIFGDFLQFETLTLCPIDTRPVILEMLTQEEREWLNSYHTKVKKNLFPHLTEREKDFFRRCCE